MSSPSTRIVLGNAAALSSRAAAVQAANRAALEQQRRDDATGSKITATTAPAPQRPGGLLDFPERPFVRPPLPVPGAIHLGWLENRPAGTGLNTTEQICKLISGDGTASQPIVFPAYPNPAPPPTITATFTSDWGGWYYFGSYGPFGSGTFWASARNASNVTIKIQRSWLGDRWITQVIMPHSNGFVLARADLADQRFTWHTYSISDTIVTRFVRGGPSDDPVAQFANPANRFLLTESLSTLPVVTSGPNEQVFARNAIEAFNVTRTSVRSLVVPSAVAAALEDITADPATIDYIPDFTYTISSPPVGNYFQPLGLATIDGVDYPNTVVRQVRGNGTQPGITNWWPTVNIPIARGPTSGINIDRFNAVKASALGLAYIDTGVPLGATLNFSGAGTPFVYRGMSGTHTTPFPQPDSRSLSHLYADMAPLPVQFSIIQAQSGGGFPNYATESTELAFPTYHRRLTNYPPESTFLSFAGEGLPSASGIPTVHQYALAPKGARLSVRSEGAQPLFGTTFGEDSYCHDQLIALGFTEGDLAP